MIDEYFTALKSRIEAHPGLSGRVYGTFRSDASGLVRDNYVILYSPVPLDVPQERFTEIQTFDGAVEFDARFKVVAVDEANARRLQAAVLTQLVGFMLTIDGRQPAKVTLGPVREVTPDTSVKPFLFYADASVEWTSRP